MENTYENQLQPNKINILLIEDNPPQAKLLQRWIEMAGNFNVTIVENGASGLHSIQNAKFHLVICDIHVPGINGLEIARIMKRENIITPILLVTAHDGMGADNQALRDLADDYLTKPFSKSVILRKIDELLAVQKERALTDAA